MSRRPTIIDVAEKAGVSKSTVSLVLQNSPAVRDKTRRIVREAMRDLGYVYNRAAAHMRGADTGQIGLIINDLRNPFFTEFATSLQMTLAARGYATVVANTDENPDLQQQVIESMVEHGVSGLILCPAYDRAQASFDRLEQAGVPAMQMLRKVDPRTDLFPFISPDYVAGSLAATQHLVNAGARRIAFIGGLKGRSVTQERMAGYLQITEQNRMKPLVLPGRVTRSFGRATAHVLAQEHPDVDAALCFNDLVALGLLSGCAEQGRRVGADLRIVGFDGIEDVALTHPTISSVDCDIAQTGKTAAETMLTWLDSHTAPPPETRTPVTLTIRQSSAP